MEPAVLSYIQKVESDLERLIETIKEVPEVNYDALRQIEQSILDLKEESLRAKEDDLYSIHHQLNIQYQLAEKLSKPRSLPQSDSPFFGHLEIIQEGKAKDLYLAHQTFSHRDLDFRLIDWKAAPIAKVFYQYREGEEFDLDLEERTIEGEIRTRSILTIVGGKLFQVEKDGKTYRRGPDGNWITLETQFHNFEGGEGAAYSDLTIGTGMTDFKSVDVMSRLDRDQFEIVNHDASEPLLIIGGAGSGKTTVALYRIGKLCESGGLREHENLVLVPNEGLVRLSKELLNKIGLQKVRVSTVFEILSQAAFNSIIGLTRDIRHDGPSLSGMVKRKHILLEAMDIYVDHLCEEAKTKLSEYVHPDLFDRVLRERKHLIPTLKALQNHRDVYQIARVKVREAFKEYRNIFEMLLGLYSFDRLEKILKEDENSKITSQMISVFKDRVGQQIGTYDDDGAYLEDAKKNKNLGFLDREDIPLLLILRQKLTGFTYTQKQESHFKHIFLDEAQELSSIELRVLRALLHPKGNFSIAGDSVQQIDPTMSFSSWNEVLSHLGIENMAPKQLNVSYRAPKEIVEFAHHVLGPLAPSEVPETKKSTGPILRDQIQHFGHATAILTDALEELVSRERKATIAIICQTKEAAKVLYSELEEMPEVRLVEDADFSFRPGIDITTVEQIRGLEFDYVIMPDLTRSDYPDKLRSRKRLHLGATRAIHQLWIMHPSQYSVLLPW